MFSVVLVLWCSGEFQSWRECERFCQIHSSLYALEEIHLVTKGLFSFHHRAIELKTKPEFKIYPA